MGTPYCITKDDHVHEFNRYWRVCQNNDRPSIKAHLRGKRANVAIDYFTTMSKELSADGIDALRAFFFELACKTKAMRNGQERYSVGARDSYFFRLPRAILEVSLYNIAAIIDRHTVCEGVGHG